MVIAIVGPMYSGADELAKYLEQELNREAVVINSYYEVNLFATCVKDAEEEFLFVDLDIPKEAAWRRAEEQGIGKSVFETIWNYTSRRPGDFVLDRDDSILKSVKFTADISIEEIGDTIDELLVKMQWKKENPLEAEELGEDVAGEA